MPKCKTPGAHFCSSTRYYEVFDTTSVTLDILIPSGVVVTQERAEQIEKVFHDTFEELMAEWFKKD